MKISILCNDKSGNDFEKCHGFSSLIETSTASFIYDTGFGDVAVNNAKRLGINLKKVRGIIISHGHYDHTDGLKSFLKETGPIDVFVGIKAFAKKVKGDKNIGFPLSRGEAEKMGANIIKVEEPIEIHPGLKIFTCAKLSTGEEPCEEFVIKTENGVKRDFFQEELTLVLRDGNSAHVITGCSHRGIGNILLDIHNQGFTIKSVVGGFHLTKDNISGVDTGCKILKKLEIPLIRPCHCTGDTVVEKMKHELPGKVFEVNGGDVYII